MIKKQKVHVGIDPGKNGAIVVVAESDGAVLGIEDVRLDRLELPDIQRAKAWLEQWEITRATVERPQAFGKNGYSMMWLGFSFGSYRTVIEMLAPEALCHYPWPAQWKKAMGISKDKESSLLRAEQLHPGISVAFKRTSRSKPNHDRAEAYLLAMFGHQHSKQLGWS